MKLLVSALEASSNIHLKALHPYLDSQVEFFGIFDSSLGKPIHRPQDFAVMGFVDVFKKIRFFKKVHKEMVELASQADKILLMDSSSFNIPLAKAIKQRYPKKEVIYYILPQVWAWKKWRAKKIERYCDTLAGILPFETSYYKHVRFVGHPLLDEIPYFKEQPSKNGTITYMPGSRRSEIKGLMPLFREVREELSQKALLVIPPFFEDSQIPSIYGDISGFEISREPHRALYDSDFAFICSGTATLESALIGTPFVLAYKAKKIDYFVARKLVKLQYAGLANIFFEKQGKEAMHIELLQDEVHVKNLLDAYKEHDSDQFISHARTLREYLQHGSSQTVANLINS